MDYRGQKLCEYIYSILVVLFGAVAWLVGYIHGDFSLTFKGWAVGTVISLLVSGSAPPLLLPALNRIGGRRMLGNAYLLLVVL